MRVLVRLPNWVGDVVMSIGSVRALSQHFPDAEIEIIVRKELAEIVSYFPGVTKVHAFPRDSCRGLRKLYKYGRKCRTGRSFSHYITFPLSFSSAWMGWASGATTRIGYSADTRSFLLTKTYRVPKNIHRAEEYAYLVQQCFGLQKLQLGMSLQLPSAPSPLLPTGPLRIVLHFVSNNTARTLPISLAHTYIDKLAKRYPEAQFFMVGSASQRAYNAEIIAGRPILHPRLHNLAGETTVLQLGQLLAEAELLVSTESGPNHLANSLGCPLLVLIGASNEHNTGPYIKRRQLQLRASNIPCAPCLSEVCKWGEPRCLLAIDAEELLSASERLLRPYSI